MAESRNICPACQSMKIRASYTIKNLVFNRCLNCSMVFLSQILTKEDLKSIYDRDDYQQFSYYVDGLEKSIADYRVKWLKNELELPKKVRVLDFGCGDGLFLAQLRDSFPFFELYGLDLSMVAVEKGKRLYNLNNLVSGEINEETFPKDFFDLITMYHVVEHLQEPDKVLNRLFYVLKPGGKIVITTPNEDYLLLKSFKVACRVSRGYSGKLLEKFYNKEHINSFTVLSLKYLMERCGFRVLKIHQDERYVTKFCLSCFNIIVQGALKAVTFLSRSLKMEAEITVVGEKI